MSLGFGPSIEYEIVSQPSVVDLLVSFCYSAAKAGKLDDFPVGMDLKVPSTESYKGNYHRHKGEFQFDDAMETRIPLKDGDWILITVEGNASEEWHARVTETCYWPTVKVAQPIYSRLVAAPATVSSPGAVVPTPVKQSSSPDDMPVIGGIPGDTDIREVNFRIYNANFDDLVSDEKRKNVASMLNTLPPISEMKAWLQKNTNPGDEASLRKWRNRISPSALGILRWVIASNRSCIVPLEGSGGAASSGFLPVQGMGSEWKQFRFAMGAPDKEQRFVNSVRDAQKRLGLRCKCLFFYM
jgi:ubiquitin-conjugating enzyme E2 Q